MCPGGEVCAEHNWIADLLLGSRLSMHDLTGLLLLLVFAALCIVLVVRTQIQENKLDSSRAELKKQEVLFQSTVTTKAMESQWNVNWRPLQGVRRVELTLRQSSVQLALPPPLYGRILGGECILPTEGMSIRFSRERFLFMKHECIIIKGEQLGISVERAVYSKHRMQDIWNALAAVGIRVTP
jgi:hypothetical protein